PAGRGMMSILSGAIESGRYSIEGVPRGHHDIGVRGHALRALDVPDGVGSIAVDIDLGGVSISGRVLDPDGRPVPQANVTAIPARILRDATLREIAGAETETDSGGSFTLPDMDDGAWILAVSAAGFAAARAGPLAPGGGAVTVTLERGAAIRLRALGADGQIPTFVAARAYDAAGLEVSFETGE